MIPPLHILCAKLQVRAYEPSFVQNGVVPDLSDLGRQVTNVIWGDDGSGVGRVPFGFFSEELGEGPICTIRGTQMPHGSLVEWLDDLEAILVPWPFAPGKVHKGFFRVYRTLQVDVGHGTMNALGVFLRLLTGVVVHGHSLGAPLATYAALEGKCGAPVLFASPKAGDSLFAKTAATLWDEIPSYRNPNDVVPKVPITIDDPLDEFNFVQVAPFIDLDPASVTPPIGSSWDDSHSMSSYLTLLAAQS